MLIWQLHHFSAACLNRHLLSSFGASLTKLRDGINLTSSSCCRACNIEVPDVPIRAPGRTAATDEADGHVKAPAGRAARAAHAAAERATTDRIVGGRLLRLLGRRPDWEASAADVRLVERVSNELLHVEREAYGLITVCTSVMDKDPKLCKRQHR